MLDYLRISIIVAVILRKGKDELIDLIDDSLIDDEKGEQLSSWLSSTKVRSLLWMILAYNVAGPKH